MFGKTLNVIEYNLTFGTETRLVNIFGCDLYDKETLLKTFKELIGDAKTKPFECVGTTKEVRFSISYLINKLDKNNLPYLLKYYFENYELTDPKEPLLYEFNEENNLPIEFVNLLKEEVKKCIEKL